MTGRSSSVSPAKASSVSLSTPVIARWVSPRASDWAWASSVDLPIPASPTSLLLAVAFGAVGVALQGHSLRGFLPSEDQGAFFVEVRLPEGSSVNRTDAAMRQVETALRGIEGVARRGPRSTGYSFLDGLAKSNSGFAIVSMKPVRRAHRPERGSVFAALATANARPAQAIREAQVFAFNLPPIIGLGTGSGFEYQLL